MGRRGIPTLEWQDFCDLVGAEGQELVDSALGGSWIGSDLRAAALERDGGRRVTFRWVKALDVAQWRYFDGRSIAECGRRLDVSRQRADQLLTLLERAHPISAPDHDAVRAEARARMLAEIFTNAVHVVRAEPGVLQSDLAQRVGCSDTDLVSVLGDLSHFVVNPAFYAAKQGKSRWSDDEIATILREVHKVSGGKVVTRSLYERLSKRALRPVPSHHLISRRYGSWSAALRRAGLEANDPTHRVGLGPEVALRNMIDYVLETGKTSLGEYARWAQDRPATLKVPHALLGRGRNWTVALTQVFDALKHGEDGRDFRAMFDHLARERAAELHQKYGVEFTVIGEEQIPPAAPPKA